MKNIKLVLSILVLLLEVLVAQMIDSEKSIVNFSISNMKVNRVNGTFAGMQGTINFDINDMENASFNVCIDPSTVNTNNEKRDHHLLKEDFFYVEEYPAICFVSSRIVKKENGYHAKGKLTMHGVTKDVEGDFIFDGKKFAGNVSVNRFDYKIGEGTNSFMVGEDVDLEIICILK